MSHQSDFREALVAGDVRRLRRMWATAFPGMPQPASAEQAEIMMHVARTQVESLELKPRAYSHRWLTERDLPSHLPDKLKPAAERMYPVVAEGVGISVNFRSRYMKPAMLEVRGAMEDAVSEAYADKRTDPVFVSRRMREAKERTLRALFGR